MWQPYEVCKERECKRKEHIYTHAAWTPLPLPALEDILALCLACAVCRAGVRPMVAHMIWSPPPPLTLPCTHVQSLHSPLTHTNRLPSNTHTSEPLTHIHTLCPATRPVLTTPPGIPHTPDLCLPPHQPTHSVSLTHSCVGSQPEQQLRGHRDSCPTLSGVLAPKRECGEASRGSDWGKAE